MDKFKNEIYENKYLVNNDEIIVLEVNVVILFCNFGRRFYIFCVKGRFLDGWDWGICFCLIDGFCFVENDIY